MIFRAWLCIWTKERVVFSGLFVHRLYVILKVNVEIKLMHLLRNCLKYERWLHLVVHHPLVLHHRQILHHHHPVLLLHMVQVQMAALEPVALRRHVGGTGLDIAAQEVGTT
jgi:hypothetical protein